MVVEITSPLREITCHMGSHLPASRQRWLSRPLPQPKLVLDSATAKACKSELTWLWLYPGVFYMRNTISYLRNNGAVSWPRIESRTASRRFNVLTTKQPIYHAKSYRFVIRVFKILRYDTCFMRVHTFYLSLNTTKNIQGGSKRADFDDLYLQGAWIKFSFAVQHQSTS